MQYLDPKQPTQTIDNELSSVCSLEARATTDGSLNPPTYGDKKRREFEPRFSTAKLLYKTVDDLDSKNFSSRISECRSGAFFVRHEESGEVRVRSFHCGLRWCPICASSRQAWIATECERWFIQVQEPRLVTLTMKHTNAPLTDQVNALYSHFQKFRKRKFFKDRTRGGVWFFHIKKSQTDHKWHPHLHCLIDSDFLEHARIKELWHKITGNSKIVHIKAVTNPTNSVKHAARYSAEPCDLSTLSLIDGLELYYALNGRRLAGTWGSARMISFRPKPDPEAKKWKQIGSYDMVRQLKDSDDNAHAIWWAYCLGKPVAANVSMYNLELQIYDNFMRAPPKFDPQGRFNFAA